MQDFFLLITWSFLTDPFVWLQRFSVSNYQYVIAFVIWLLVSDLLGFLCQGSEITTFLASKLVFEKKSTHFQFPRCAVSSWRRELSLCLFTIDSSQGRQKDSALCPANSSPFLPRAMTTTLLYKLSVETFFL